MSCPFGTEAEAREFAMLLVKLDFPIVALAFADGGVLAAHDLGRWVESIRKSEGSPGAVSLASGAPIHRRECQEPRAVFSPFKGDYSRIRRAWMDRDLKR